MPHQPDMSDDELRKAILSILFRINEEEDSSNYVLGSILVQWTDEIIRLIKSREQQVAVEARLDELVYMKQKTTGFTYKTKLLINGRIDQLQAQQNPKEAK